MQEQMLPFVQSFLFSLFCDFERAIVHNAMDNGGFTGAVFTDLSEGFDCLNYELLIARLNAFGLSRYALLFDQSYLTDRKQGVRVNGSCSTWIETVLGVPQGSVLGPLLINIYLNDIFIFLDGTNNL